MEDNISRSLFDFVHLCNAHVLHIFNSVVIFEFFVVQKCHMYFVSVLVVLKRHISG